MVFKPNPGKEAQAGRQYAPLFFIITQHEFPLFLFFALKLNLSFLFDFIHIYLKKLIKIKCHYFSVILLCCNNSKQYSRYIRPKTCSHNRRFYCLVFRYIRKTYTVADPGGAPPARIPPKGPDSFILTYKFFKT